MKILYLVHESEGRVRFRLPWLRDDRAAAERLADALADEAGVIEVRVRPYTGSVLCLFDPAEADAQKLGRALAAAAGTDEVTRPGHESPEQLRELVRASLRDGSELTRVFGEAARGLHADVLRATGARASVGTVATLLLWLGALGELATSEEVELPRWHQLIYWGFRSFGALEADALAHLPDPLAADSA